MQIFGKDFESAKLFANTKGHILARKSAKIIANFSATEGTSLPSHSLSLSLSLSLCISDSHRAHLTHNIGSASALPIMYAITLVHTRSGILSGQQKGYHKS